MTLRAAGLTALLFTFIALGDATAGDNRTQRYFDSVSRCGVIGYCKVTAADILRRGPTGGGRDPFSESRYRDRCDHIRRYHGRPCHTYHRSRSVFPQMYVDVFPSEAPGVRPRSVRPVAGHIGWCAKRYRSYRAFDNTFLTHSGQRRQCRWSLRD